MNTFHQAAAAATPTPPVATARRIRTHLHPPVSASQAPSGRDRGPRVGPSADAATHAIQPPPAALQIDTVDDDGDGKPGLTVTIEVTPEFIGELCIARREIFAFEAFLTEPDLLAGQVTDGSEQLVIGASDPVFASSPANWGRYPDLSKSPIILRRVDADWDCERLAAERDDLFPPTPDVDW